MTPSSDRIVYRPLKKHELISAARLKFSVIAEAWAPHVYPIRQLLTRRSPESEARGNLPIWRRGRVFGAFASGTLVGVSRAIFGYHNEVSDLWVFAPSRECGIGSMLFGRAEAELRRRGIRTARLYTAAFNSHAIAFYRARGWRIERRNMHRTSHVRRVRMIKRLR
ncbi:MAG: GNAT family N-acetyltransferase [Rhodobacteraceae bacterium]|nr:GNAT family N-acetyltransferase [Paracoccaceae bacterium]